MDGILNINKPTGKTSYAVVAMVKRLTGEKRVGHAGTLDPNASGVLPICIGQATRLVEYLMLTTKTYLAEIELGISTDTYDKEGTVTATRDCSAVTEAKILEALQAFIGEIQQTPPIYSALKHQGKPLYELARAGVSVEIKSRPASIKSIVLKDWHAPVLTIEVVCGKGTYIRSIANDLGEALGCGGTLRNLIRTRVGVFDYKNALTLEQFEESVRTGYWESLLYPLDSMLENWQAVVVGGEMAKNIRNGIAVAFNSSANQDHLRAYTGDGALLGVMRFDKDKQLWQPEKVFASLTPPDLCGTNNSRACEGNCCGKGCNT
ncbi:MAG: tRNA pseudouridine(55) synthase TruB [Dehalococcoidales bacterium]|nr:tRNA pseudouridine(55) synthase TruB [Dehalococcoidales bacterium]